MGAKVMEIGCRSYVGRSNLGGAGVDASSTSKRVKILWVGVNLQCVVKIRGLGSHFRHDQQFTR